MTVLPFTNRMTEADFKAARQKHRETYGDGKRGEGDARAEQELARLFYVSGWTVDELGKSEGVDRSRISQRVIFGRFLDFVSSTAVDKSQNSLKTLREFPFRKLFRKTDPDGNERQRFTAVLDMLANPSAEPPTDLAKDIAAGQFANGKYHLLEDLATAFDVDPKVATAALDKLGKKKCKLEKKAFGNSFKFRLFKQERPIAVEEIAEKLGPIVKALFVEGKKGPARISGANVTIHASRLQKLLDEWCG